MSRRMLLPLVLLVALLSSGCWIEDGGMAGRMGWNASETTFTPQNMVGLVEHSSQFFSGSGFGSPYSDGSRIYVHYLDAPLGTLPDAAPGLVKAFDKQTMQPIWTSPPIQGSFNSSLTIAGGRLLVPTDGNGTSEAIVYELDPATGAIITQDHLGVGQLIRGSIVYDGTTAAVVVRSGASGPLTDPAHLWFGNPGNTTGSTFTNVALIPATATTAPAMSGNTMIIASLDRAFGFDTTPARSPGTSCTPTSLCGPVWTSPQLAVRVEEVTYPVVLSPQRVLLADGGFGGRFEVVNASSGAPVWMGTNDSSEFIGTPAATSTQLFNGDGTGRVRVFAAGDCTAAGSPPTCHPTKVFVPVAPHQGSGIVFQGQPVIAGQLLVVQTQGTVSFYDIGCSGSGSDAVSHLPQCGPVATIGVDVRSFVITDGAIYITTPIDIERWSLPAAA